MNVLRRLLVSLATIALVILLGLTAWSLSLKNSLGDADNVKAVVQRSGTYDNLVDGVLQQAQADLGQGSPAGSLDLSHPRVQEAAKKAFTPEVLQNSTEEFIDGIYGWLQGDTPQPVFRIDLTPARDRFLDEMAVYAKERYNNLPVCTSVPENLDPFSVECRAPAGSVDIDAEVAKGITQVKSEGPLANPVITAEDFKNEQGEPVFPDSQNVSRNFEIAQRLWWIFALLALLSALGVFLLSSRKTKGLRRIAVAAIIAGILLLLGVLLNKAGLGAITSSLNRPDNAGQTALINSVLVPLVRSMEQAISQSLVQFGLIYVAIGLIALGGAYLWKRRHPDASVAKPEPPAGTPPTTPEAKDP